ncbi:MAG: helix-turn-helix domain-containing protein [Candidatus Pacearchaeota archaeon]|nr:helix-turn-helix domain-containing protein [Candidatus Pacearchaeota archaeon]
MIEEKNLLERIGFTLGESRYYLSLLSLGESTVGPIAKESYISISKIYDVLNRLIKKDWLV